MNSDLQADPGPPLQAAPSKDAMRRLVGGVGVIRAGQRGETRTGITVASA
jgi:hypothetical protein